MSSTANNTVTEGEELDNSELPVLASIIRNVLSEMIKGPNLYRCVTRGVGLALSSSGYKQAGHVMIYCPVSDVRLFNYYPVQHAVMMQMRFDGSLGFPGGYIDKEDTSLEEGICREVREELGKKHLVFDLSIKDHVVSHVCESKKLCLHFYAKEVPFSIFKALEVRDPDNDGDFENLGLVRVPMFLLRNQTSGFPNFLQNNFIEIAKEQLIYGIQCRKLIEPAKLNKYLSIAGDLDIGNVSSRY